MPDLFGIDIAGIIAAEIGPGLLPATLIVVTPGTRSSANLSGGTQPTEESFSGKGFIEDYSDRHIKEGLVEKNDRKITLIAKTFTGNPIPKLGHKITIEGSTYKIVGPVKRDPAAATYTCQSRQ